MRFSLDVRRARKGDCFLLHYGTPADPGLALIDGGPSNVYKPQLVPRLAAVRTARGLAAAAPLPVDLLMVSHIDDDHINGILELTKELVSAQDARRPLPLKIRGVWYNAFDDLIGDNPQELLASVTATFGPASLSGEPDVQGLNPDTARILASIGQGIQLRDDLRKLKLRVNAEFGGELVMAAKGHGPADMTRGLTIAVAGPMKAELVKLQKDHDAFLKAKTRKTVPASLAAFTDTSVPNLSSIVVLATVGSKRVLLTGDARGDKILEGLELAAVLRANKPLHVDILKMPHHGSDRNMAQSFLERVTADHYVMSGDGEYGNPERGTLDMLRLARGTAPYTIHLTYPIEEIDASRKDDWEKEQQKEKGRKRTDPTIVVRPNWSAKDHSLAALFAQQPAFAAKVRIVPAAAPHVIDLLDPLGF